MKETVPLKIENEEIVFSDLTNRERLELIAVCQSENVFLLDVKTKEVRKLGNLGFLPVYSEDQFKYFEKVDKPRDYLQIQSHLDYLCIVQKYGQNGLVLNLEKSNFRKELKRGDYHVEHCSFPIAFYSGQDRTFLIHGTDWNRLDITCLETDELLTERVIDNRTRSNYLDYFHSSLLVSPDEKHFSSNGWVWQPCDMITVYPIEKFLREFEMANTFIDFGPVDGYNWDRPLCWIDNTTLGIGYNKREDDENEGEFPSGIIFVDILENQMTNRIEFDGFELSEYGAPSGELFFDSDKNQFLGLNGKSGLLISDVRGKEIYKNSSLTSYRYSKRHKLYFHFDLKQRSLNMVKPEI